MDYENLLFEIDDGIAIVTINRPKVLNALNGATLTELRATFKRVADDPNIKCAILTGSGEKSFVAGADINEISTKNAVTGVEFALNGQSVSNQIQHCGKPIIAAVNGFALGGGCEIAMACHLRFASEKARFGQPEVNLGIIPGYGGTQRLARLVGAGRALELCISGNMINAQEAYRIGLVNQLYSPEELLPKTKEFCKTVMSKGPKAVSFVLHAVNRGMEMPLADALRLEAHLFGLVCATDDMKEGTAAFMEKREAKFTGK
ncbi:crotonase [candidate division LCP-89 bacterium B3_LCP]|uniref:Crotonase n=1 Tax=candidate division LCP-89 bacterium B3_LCP TaxID=2012998 RepID=A0A532UZ94_UNCL8|nr:MAG: crotonase [candidate division LCP-89 bacterium B3_LCP]